MTTCVYRLYSESGDLLYVGISKNVKSRLATHRSRVWWPQVARSEVDEYPTRQEALSVERQTIKSERPRYNRVNHPNPGPRVEDPHIRVDIPDELHRQLKVRAATTGVTLKDLVTRYLTEGTQL